MDLDEPMNSENRYHCSKLPDEVWFQIFEKLSLSDLQEASLVCKYWYSLTCSAKFQSRILVKIGSQNSKISLSDKLAPAKYFLNSKRKFHHLQVKLESKHFKLHMFFCSKFLRKFGETIQTLQLIELDISVDTFFKILCAIKNPLKELILERCIHDKNPDEFLEKFSNFCDTSGILSELVKLQVNFHSIKFNVIRSHRMQILVKLLSLNLSTLRYLKIYEEITELLTDTNFIEIWKSLELVGLIFDCRYPCEPIWSDYKDLILQKTNLKTLILGCFADINIGQVARTLPFLKKFQIDHTDEIDNSNLRNLLEMKNLNSYYFINCCEFANDLLEQFNPHEVNYQIETLVIRDYKLGVCNVIECFPNLVFLDISKHSKCLNSEKNATIQLIIKHCRLLRYLNLSGNRKITNYGLTGTDVKTGEQTGHCINELNLITLNLRLCVKLTDFTLIKAIKFLELRSLNLQGNEHFTAKGIESVVENCPSMEDFLYSNRNWNTFDIIKKVRRLKSFGIACNTCNNYNILDMKSYSSFTEVLGSFCNKCHQTEFQRKIRRLSVFNGFPEQLQFQIFNNMEIRSYNKGEYIYRKGERCNKFFLIMQGAVTLVIRSAKTNQRSLFQLSIVDSFGETGFQGDLQTEDVYCHSKKGVICRVLDADVYNDLITKYKEEKILKRKAMCNF